MASQERVLKINKVIWTTKSRVIHAQILIPKQYRMMMSSFAMIKFIKTIFSFRYHTKGVSNQVSSISHNKVKSYSCSRSTTNGAIRGLQIGAGFRDYKLGQ